MLDTTRSIETPEGVVLQFKIAGPIVRALAWVIDLLIRAVIYFIVALFLGYLQSFGTGLFLIIIFLLEWFYPIFYEVYRQGATPGKRAMHIKVLQDNGTPITFSNSMIRNLLRIVDFLPFFYGFGLISVLFNSDFKRLGDLAAGTVVVYDDEKLKKLVLPDVSPSPLTVPLNLEEQLAIVHFAERSQIIPPNRVVELANLVEPLTKGKDQTAVTSLHRIAKGLVS